MSDEFKCPEGWEISPYDHLALAPDYLDVSEYIYKILRRKKTKPMPEVKVGDTIRYDGKMCHVIYVSNNYMNFIEPSGTPNGWVINEGFAVCDDAAIYRGGVKIWEHGE